MTVIDGATDSVITTITVESGPYALDYNFLNNKVYCANSNSSTVTVIQGAIDSVITTIPVGYYPRSLVYNSSNNKVYCANAGELPNFDTTVTVIDGSTDSVITTVPVGIYPLALTYNAINKKVFCANDVSDNLTVIDGVSDTVIKTITVGGSPRAFAWNPIQNRTYVANYSSNTVSVIKDSIILGIEEENSKVKIQSAKLLEVYPNPAKSVLRVRCPLPVKEIKIFDVSGKMIREIASATMLPRNDDVVKISLKGINPGIYFLRTGKETKKFLVVK